MKNAGRYAGLTTLCAAVSLIAAGCGSGTPGGSPTNPTRSSQTAEQGQGHGQGQGDGQGQGEGQGQSPTAPPGMPVQTQQNEVEFTGQVTALVGTCPTLRLTISGNAIVTSGSTAFDKLPCPQVRVGQTVEIKGTRQADGSVSASRVHTEDAPDNDPARDDEVSGTLSQLAGRCPSITFTAGGRRIATNGATEFKDGSCAALANGNPIEAKGTTQADGSLLASRVERKR
jgi:hypothetical protein